MNIRIIDELTQTVDVSTKNLDLLILKAELHWVNGRRMPCTRSQQVYTYKYMYRSEVYEQRPITLPILLIPPL